MALVPRVSVHNTHGQVPLRNDSTPLCAISKCRSLRFHAQAAGTEPASVHSHSKYEALLRPLDHRDPTGEMGGPGGGRSPGTACIGGRDVVSLDMFLFQHGGGVGRPSSEIL